MSKFWAAALFIPCLSLPMVAQTVSGTISGTVVDPSSLPIAGATVTLRNEDTGAQQVQTTGGAGAFVFTAVLPGRYTVVAEMTGFKKVEKRDLHITAAERLSAGDLMLPLGTVTEMVTVEGAGTPVQISSSERSGLLTTTQMSTLMARGRDFLSLLRLMPGVVPSASGDVDAIGTRAAYPSAQGMRISYPSVTFDGVTNNDLGSSQTTPTPVNMDAIAEVKVLMNNYQAEYGRTAGVLVQAVTKSGTNRFHGGGYYYKRHEQFNANNFFANRSGTPKPRYRFNTWGYNLGGPVYIPNVFPRKDKLFFFFSQEILPTSTPQSIVQVNVPTQAQRNGDFSGLATAIRDPVTGAAFAGNVIPPNRIDPNGQKLLSVFPPPNSADPRGNYIFQEVIPATRYNEVYRVDYNISDKTRMYVRGFNFRLNQSGYNIGGGGSGAPWGELKTRNRFSDDGGVVNAVHIFSPSVVSETGFGVHHSIQAIFPFDKASIDKLSRTALGITVPQFYPQLNPLNLIPWASFGGISNAASFTWDSRFPTKSADTVFDLTSSVSKIWGAHTFKAGVYYERVRYFGGQRGTNWGQFDFSSDTNNPLDTRYAYSNALLGVFRSYQESSTRVETNGRGNTLAWFLQDTWKAKRRLTLDYGLRFSWYTPYTDRKNLASSFVPSLYSLAQAPRLYYPTLNAAGQRIGYDRVTGATVPAVLIGAFVPGTGNTANGMVQEGTSGFPRGLMNHQGVLFAPRLGFSYDLFGNGKTALRGGFGIVYNERERVLLLDVATTPPIQYTPIIYYGSFSTLLQSAGNLSPSSTAGLSLAGKVPTVYNYSLGIQREIGFKTVLDVAYVGALGRHLLQLRNINTLPYGRRFLASSQDPTTGRPLSDIYLAPYPGYSSIQIDEFASSSNYHSMQVQLNRRFARGLQFAASWTWSKSMDFASNDWGSVAHVAPIRIWNYGKSDFDRTHIVQINWTWDIPAATKLVKNRVVGAVADHWQLSGIASFISGAPTGVSFTALGGVDIPGGGDGVRPLVISNPILPKSERTLARYFRTDVFAVPAVGTFGNAPRDVFRGPGINNFDVSIFKNVPVFKERARFQLRFEAYNLFNHTQFSGVNTSATFNTATGQQTNAAFGNVTSARPARVGQASLRFIF